MIYRTSSPTVAGYLNLTRDESLAPKNVNPTESMTFRSTLVRSDEHASVPIMVLVPLTLFDSYHPLHLEKPVWIAGAIDLCPPPVDSPFAFSVRADELNTNPSPSYRDIIGGLRFYFDTEDHRWSKVRQCRMQIVNDSSSLLWQVHPYLTGLNNAS